MITFEPLADDAKNFLLDRTGIDFHGLVLADPNWVCATSRSPAGAVNGALLGEFVTSFDVHMTCALDDPSIISRRLLHAIFTTFFSRAVRVTAHARPDNEKSIWGIQRLGFKYEGYCRLGIEGRWDALVFGMLRNECRWIRPQKEKLREVA